MSPKRRLAVVVSHPIQYFAPLWRALARDGGVELHVIFASRAGLDKTLDVEMLTEVAWATDLIRGYSHEFLSEAQGVAAALARFRPDAAIIHGYASKTMLRALVWCKLRRVRALLTADSSVHVSARGPRRWIKQAAAPPLLRCFDAVLTMGDRSERHLERLGYPRARMFRTPVMIDEGFWRAREGGDALRRRARDRLGLGASDFALLCVCKLSARKRVADLVAAVAEISRDPGAPRVTLLVAGDGEERAALQAAAASHGVDARWLGFVNIDALPELYAAADALAHAATREQYGMIALEASIMGLPLVLSDETGAVGPSSIAREGVNALCFRCGDVEGLAAKLRRLRDDAALRRRMSDASLAISREHEGARSVTAIRDAMGA